jgi:hypothetical protein
MPVAEVAEIMIEVGLVSDVPPAGGSVGNSKTAST